VVVVVVVAVAGRRTRVTSHACSVRQMDGWKGGRETSVPPRRVSTLFLSLLFLLWCCGVGKMGKTALVGVGWWLWVA